MAMITRNQIQAHREAENYLFAAGTTAITTYALASGFGKVGPLLQNSRAQDLCKTIASVASSVSFKAAGMAAILGMFCVTDRFSSHPPLPDQIEQMARVHVPEIAQFLPDEAILAVLKVYPNHPDVRRMAGPALMRLRQKRIAQFVRMAEWFKRLAVKSAIGSAVGGVVSAGIKEIHLATMLRANEPMENIVALRLVLALAGALTVGVGAQASAYPMGARLRLLCKLLSFYTSAMAIVGAVSDGKKGFWFGSEVGIMMGLGSGIGSVTEIITGTAGADKKIALGMLGLGTGSLGIAMGLANPKIRMMVASEAAQNALRGRTRHLAGSVVESFGKGAVAGGTVALAGHLLVLPLVARFNGGATARVTEALSALSLAAGILA